MEREEILNQLTSVFHKVFGNSNLVLTDELTANHVENWDSLTHMLLISEIETKFSIKFKLKELNKMKNVGDMIAVISEKL